MRASGILMHISSLPSPCGIGSLGKEAFDFVDFLARAGQKYWQILPIGPTSYGDSPYQSFSTFAGNPYFIDLGLLELEGLLEKYEYESLNWGDSQDKVNYETLYNNRFIVLQKAFDRGFTRDSKEVADFRLNNASWVEDYSMFMALKDHFGGKSWNEWEDDIRLREKVAMDHYRGLLSRQIDFWAYLQYLFYNQWTALKFYANKMGVSMIGDLPIYVAMDSADVWANPTLFQLDEALKPKYVAGVPPDYFAPDGQLWGNPIYDWEQHQLTGFKWWIERIRAVTNSFDMVRIDHFRGFAGFYAVPADDENAKNGHWEKGPGVKVFRAVRDALGERSIIAEDLGVLTQDVYDLLEASGFPGMKVLQFAFDSDWDNAYLPHNHIKHCVVYTGTHDNDTLMNWWRTAISDSERNHAYAYMHLTEDEGVNWGMLRTAWSSVAELVIAPIQDFLALGGDSRMNSPSTLGGNWQFRLRADSLNDGLADKIERLSGMYQRSNH